MEHAIELRAALRGGAGPLLGFWATIPSPLTAEVAAMAGADYVVVDQQHGAVDPTAMVAMLQAIRLGGAAALVRVARNDPWIIGNALDLGALGVIVPMVESAEQAAEAVAACRYATQGVRSVGVLRGTSGSGALEPPLCLVMVETRAGLDGIYVGPSDLALSLGLQPTVRLEHAPVLDGIRRVREACAAADRLCGLHCLDAHDVPRFAPDGFAMLTMGGDLAFLRGALEGALTVARGR